MKLAIVVRKDLGMSCGKIAGQVGHASVLAYDHSTRFDKESALKWLSEGQKKIVLKVNSEEEIHALDNKARILNINTEKVYDFGLTQIAPNTLTCIAIGPNEDDKIDSVIKELKLL